MNISWLKLVTLGMLAVGAITLWANSAKADQVVYSQPVQSPLVDAGGLYTPTGSFVTADTFTLTQGATINSIQWFGSYENGNGVGFPSATAADFIVFLATCRNSDCLTNSADVGDILIDGDIPLPPTEFSPSEAHETFLGTSTSLNLAGDIPTQASNFSYHGNLSAPVQLSSGEYFLTILPQFPQGGGNSDVDWSFDAGTGGDGISQGLNPSLLDNFDLAFTLNGTPTAPVPEPSSLLMMAVGLALICLLALRRRRLPSAAPALALLALASLPAATRADTFTLDGANIDSFSFNSSSNVKTLSVVMAASDAQQFLTDIQQGIKIDVLTLEEFTEVDGTQTLENEFEFLKDTVKSFQFVSGSDMQTVDVTFTYTEFKIIKEGSGGGDGGGGGNTVPEPSSVALLASGLLGLTGFARKTRGWSEPLRSRFCNINFRMIPFQPSPRWRNHDFSSCTASSR